MENQSSTSCSAISEALDAFLDLELAPDEAQKVEAHLADCSPCQRRLAELESLVSRLKSLPEPVLTKDFADSIEARIKASHSNTDPTDLIAYRQKKEERAAKSSGFLRPMLTAAAALSLLIGGATMLNKQEQAPGIATTNGVGKVSVAKSVVKSANADDLIAEYDDIVGDGVNDFGGVNSYGLSTNEDGLYAIKL